ncbi:uncharacterized protein [Amphiura filiformis]|uniref:uncharacterized protein n=1 Tax=Amphiura filiformis TaxID=82378 RepID=UPI003B20C358
MGNTQVQDFPPVRQEERKELRLTRKVTPKEYQQHVNGEDIPGMLKEFPWALVDSISLFERLDTSFNSISRIPPEIPLRLPHLSHLNISHNHLFTLPESFSLLFHLKTLLMNHNSLQQLPESFVNLVKLERLDLSHNSLVKLPENMGEMESLRKLNVCDNKLTSLPLSFGKSHKISVLIALTNGCVQSPPQSVCQEGSEATLCYLRKQCKNGYIPKPINHGNVFRRARGDVLQSTVANPHSARAQYVQEQTQTTNTKNRIRTPLRPPLKATSLEADELMDKIVGLVYGAAIGDALGLATMNMTRDECNFYYDEESLNYADIITDKHRLHWVKGDWTTAFDQMALVLDSILQWAGVVDELDFAKRLHHWGHHGYPELGDTGGNMEFSNTIAKVLSSEKFCSDPHGVAQALWDRSYDYHDPESCDHLADNGAVVRTAVLGIPQFYDSKEVINNTLRICKASHYDPRCRATCIVISILISLMLQNQQTIHDTASLECLISQALTCGRQQLSQPAHLEQFDSYCSVPDFKSLYKLEPNRPSYTLRPMAAALIALKSGISYRDVITELVMLGADSCSNASVAGAILGCKCGYKRLPSAWVDSLPKQQTDWLDSKINLLLDMMGIP